MSKKHKKSKHRDVEIIVLAKVIIDLLKSLIELLNSLRE